MNHVYQAAESMKREWKADENVRVMQNALKQEQARDYGDTVGGCGQAQPAQPARPNTLAEQAKATFDEHSAAAQRAAAALDFLVAHPEFDKFIRLVRSGAIQF